MKIVKIAIFTFLILLLVLLLMIAKIVDSFLGLLQEGMERNRYSSFGSIFIRTTTESNFVIACQQFRTRECKNLQVSLFVQTQPIIEDSSNIQLGCFDFFYIGLKGIQLFFSSLLEHFEHAELSVFNNRWSEVYDFTPSHTPHFSFLSSVSSHVSSYM